MTDGNKPFGSTPDLLDFKVLPLKLPLISGDALLKLYVQSLIPAADKPDR